MKEGRGEGQKRSWGSDRRLPIVNDERGNFFCGQIIVSVTVLGSQETEHVIPIELDVSLPSMMARVVDDQGVLGKAEGASWKSLLEEQSKELCIMNRRIEVEGELEVEWVRKLGTSCEGEMDLKGGRRWAVPVGRRQEADQTRKLDLALGGSNAVSQTRHRHSCKVF